MSTEKSDLYLRVNNLPQHLRELLVTLSKGEWAAGHYMKPGAEAPAESVAHDNDLERKSRMMVGAALTAVGLLLLAVSLFIVFNNKMFWPVRGLLFSVPAVVLVGLGGALLLYASRSQTLYKLPWGGTRSFIFPDYRMNMYKGSVSISYITKFKLLKTVTHVTKRKSGGVVKNYDVIRWNVMHGTRSVFEGKQNECEDFIRNFQTLRANAAAARQRGDSEAMRRFDPMEADWALLAECERRKTDPDGSALSGPRVLRSRRSRAIAALPIVLMLPGLLMVPLLCFGKEYNYHQRIVENTNGLLCIDYAEKDGFIFKARLKKACAAELWRGARYQIENREGHIAKENLKALIREYPSKKYLKKAKKALKSVEHCKVYPECP